MSHTYLKMIHVLFFFFYFIEIIQALNPLNIKSIQFLSTPPIIDPKCLVQHCKVPLFQCYIDLQCRKNLNCMQNCLKEFKVNQEQQAKCQFE